MTFSSLLSVSGSSTCRLWTVFDLQQLAYGSPSCRICTAALLLDTSCGSYRAHSCHTDVSVGVRPTSYLCYRHFCLCLACLVVSSFVDGYSGSGVPPCLGNSQSDLNLWRAFLGCLDLSRGFDQYPQPFPVSMSQLSRDRLLVFATEHYSIVNHAVFLLVTTVDHQNLQVCYERFETLVVSLASFV